MTTSRPLRAAAAVLWGVLAGSFFSNGHVLQGVGLLTMSGASAWGASVPPPPGSTGSRMLKALYFGGMAAFVLSALLAGTV